MGRLLKLGSQAYVNTMMGDHLRSIHFEFFQWQKY